MDTLLIIASSGRMLAQAARNAGFKPLVVDLFADLDTQQYAEDFRRVTSLAVNDLAAAVDYFVERYAVAHAVYGSGLECYPDSLYYLHKRLIMLGNHPDVFARQLEKKAFFSILDRLKIPYSEVVFTAPENAEGWLIKPMQGQGGVGIKRHGESDVVDTAVYWQKFQHGNPYSVLFLADGQRVQIIGFNSQWVVRLDELQEFIFSGVANNADLPDQTKSVITDWLARIVPDMGLKGLNSLDFIQTNGCSYVLEINPRPSASMQLYDRDLLARHIQACREGHGIEHNGVTYCDKGQYSAFQIIYADCDLTIPDSMEWPEWCMDLPKSGDLCRVGQPICSIIARQKSLQSVMEILQNQQQFIINKLKRF